MPGGSKSLEAVKQPRGKHTHSQCADKHRYTAYCDCWILISQHLFGVKIFWRWSFRLFSLKRVNLTRINNAALKNWWIYMEPQSTVLELHWLRSISSQPRIWGIMSRLDYSTPTIPIQIQHSVPTQDIVWLSCREVESQGGGLTCSKSGFYAGDQSSRPVTDLWSAFTILLTAGSRNVGIQHKTKCQTYFGVLQNRLISVKLGPKFNKEELYSSMWECPSLPLSHTVSPNFHNPDAIISDQRSWMNSVILSFTPTTAPPTTSPPPPWPSGCPAETQQGWLYSTAWDPVLHGPTLNKDASHQWSLNAKVFLCC